MGQVSVSGTIYSLCNLIRLQEMCASARQRASAACFHAGPILVGNAAIAIFCAGRAPHCYIIAGLFWQHPFIMMLNCKVAAPMPPKNAIKLARIVILFFFGCLSSRVADAGGRAAGGSAGEKKTPKIDHSSITILLTL